MPSGTSLCPKKALPCKGQEVLVSANIVSTCGHYRTETESRRIVDAVMTSGGVTVLALKGLHGLYTHPTATPAYQ